MDNLILLIPLLIPSTVAALLLYIRYRNKSNMIGKYYALQVGPVHEPRHKWKKYVVQVLSVRDDTCKIWNMDDCVESTMHVHWIKKGAEISEEEAIIRVLK